MSDDSSLKQYFKEVKKYPLLTPEEEKEIGFRIKNGDKDAEQILIHSNLRLVISIAKELKSKHGTSMPLLDLIGEGNAELLKVVKKFDPTKGKFSNYAWIWIERELEKKLQSINILRLPEYLLKQLWKYRKTKNDIYKEMQREARLDEISEKTGFTEEKTLELQELDKKIIQVDISSDPENNDLDTFYNPENDDEINEELDHLFNNLQKPQKFLECINERERKIIELRLGLVDGEPKSLEEIAKSFDCSKQNILKIERRIIKKINDSIDEKNNQKED